MKKLITASTETPVNLGLLKLHLHIDDNELDGALKQYAQSAVSEFERESGMVLMGSTWETTFQAWPRCREIRLEVRPFTSVTWIKYFLESGEEQTLSADDYEVDTDEAVIRLKRSASWPTDALRVVAPIVVRYQVGYADPDDVPADITTALWFHIQSMAAGVPSSSSAVHEMEATRLRKVFEGAVERHRVYR